MLAGAITLRVQALGTYGAYHILNALRPRRNGRHLADDIFKCIFLNENAWIPIRISLKFVPKGPINYIPALVQIMAWRRPGYKSLSELITVRLPTHICVTRPQWVNWLHVMLILCTTICIIWLCCLRNDLCEINIHSLTIQTLALIEIFHF